MRPVAKTAGFIPAAEMLACAALIAGAAILAPVALADKVVVGSFSPSGAEDQRESSIRQKSFREFVWRKKVTSSSRTLGTVGTAIIEASPATNRYYGGGASSPADGVARIFIEQGRKEDDKIRKLGEARKTTKGQSSTTRTSESGEKRKRKGKEKKKSAQSQGMRSEEDDEVEDDTTADAIEIEHYPAQSLHFLKNTIDESMFTWINPDEIKAGAVTCGFLTPPLGSLPEEPYPSIKVYFCMRFATKQPAAKGYMFTHCGGPSSLSDCSIYPDMGDANLRDYNVITMDQRGLGRSWPSFAHEECTYGMVDSTEYVNADGTPLRVQDGSKQDAFTTDPTDDDSIREFLLNQKTRMASCWTCESCDFNLEATDGSKVYQFLDYSGTQQAIEDLDRFREAIGADLISLWGVSYGTAIVSSYATASPSTVDKLVLDANMPPLPDSHHFGSANAKSRNSRMTYMVYSCSAANALNPGTCPVDDLGVCMNQVSALWPDVAEHLGDPSLDFNVAYEVMLEVVIVEEDWNSLQEICAAAEIGDIAGLAEAIDEAYGVANQPAGSTRSISNIQSQPTNKNNVFGAPNYGILMGSDTFPNPSKIPQNLILGQSMSGGAYDDDFFISQVQRIAEEYPAYGTHAPARDFMYAYGFNFYWPKTKPTSPAGSPFLTGIVVGSLFDPATPYQLTQEMKQAFPTTHLITSQWIRHGAWAAKVEIGDLLEEFACDRYIREYLELGYVTVPDGFVCGAPLPGPLDLS